jgi:hypothetical protein
MANTRNCNNNNVEETVVSTPAPTRGANSVPVAAKQNYAHGRVNHVVVEEDQEAPDLSLVCFCQSHFCSCAV